MATKLVHLSSDGSAVRDKTWSSKFDVFMSYSSADLTDVRQICDALRQHDIKIWFDLEQIEPGTWIQDSLGSALQSSFTVALVVGPRGIGRWQMAELRLAIDHCIAEDVPLIPVLLPGATGVPDNPPFLRLISQVRFMDSISEETPMRRLVESITRRRPSVPGHVDGRGPRHEQA